MANLPNIYSLTDVVFDSYFEQETRSVTSEFEIDDSIQVTDPGFAGTVDKSSDEEYVVDWDAPVRQKLIPKCSSIVFESLDVRIPIKFQKLYWSRAKAHLFSLLRKFHFCEISLLRKGSSWTTSKNSIISICFILTSQTCIEYTYLIFLWISVLFNFSKQNDKIIRRTLKFEAFFDTKRNLKVSILISLLCHWVRPLKQSEI